MKLSYLEYLKYIRFACDEEIERLAEFLMCVDKDRDDSEDKYYVAYPASNCPPDMEDVEKALVGRDMAKDFAVIDSDDESAKEDLYEELRELMLS